VGARVVTIVIVLGDVVPLLVILGCGVAVGYLLCLIWHTGREP
jgi:hypothetical protein